MPDDQISASTLRFEPSGNTHEIVVEQHLAARPSDVYDAWTQQFDRWFAEPGTVVMRAVVGEPFRFETAYEGNRYPHFGRFLALEPDMLVEMSWVTGRNGTWGAETVVRLEIFPTDSGSRVRLTHSGFYEAAAAIQHADAWPQVLRHLDEVLGDTR
jgi:uncharacterized protein YndB with AHSA1/START domain